ncbi:hypothetical protein K8T06_15905 [bacterium]|nr:hypothetical protein [bacterium]
MKQITILWMKWKLAKVIIATPSEIVVDIRILSKEPELPIQGATPDFRRIRKETRKDYFHDISEKILNSREIVIFGSDNSKEELLEYLNRNEEDVFNRVIGVEASGDMPEEKIIARGRKYI